MFNRRNHFFTASRKLAVATVTAAALAVVPVSGPVASADSAPALKGAPTVEMHRFDRPGDLTTNPHKTCMGREATHIAAGPPVIGTPGQDVIIGTDGPDVLYGMGGNDIICGFDGDDVIFGDDADPALSDGGLDTINGGKGDDDIHGGPRQDFLQGSSGNDLMYGDLPGTIHGFTDNIEGGMGHDEIVGGPGADNVWGDRKDGGFGNDLIDTTTDDPTGGDYAYAGRGDDVILAQNGTGQHVEGQSGNDTCLVDEMLDTWSTCEWVI